MELPRTWTCLCNLRHRPIFRSRYAIGFDFFDFLAVAPCSEMTFMARFYPIVIGPIVGGFVAENPKLGWHFNFWISLMFSVLTLVVGFFYTPETVRT